MREKNEISLASPPLKAIFPNQYDRFSPVCVQDPLVQNDPSIRCPQARSQFCASDPDRPDQPPIEENLVHPEGGIAYVHKNLVSDRPISASLRSIGEEISSKCCKLGLSDITVFLRRQGSAVEYYVAAHSDETVVWINNQSPDELRNINQQRVKNVLSEEYWGHMEAIPGSRYVSLHSVSQLKIVLSSLAIDSATSDGSTSPFSYKQIQDFLQLLNSFTGNHPDEYQTYAVARIWNMIWHARTINNFGSSDPCLDRFITLSNNPPVFTALNRILALVMLGAAERNLARCSRAWAGRVAYVSEWRQFKTKNEVEWQQVIKLASVTVIASLMLQNEFKSKLSASLSTLLSLLAAASGHHLVTESQNLGEHAADASTYFQHWEKPDYNVQRIALRNAAPQALLGWAFIALVGSVIQVV